MEAKHKHKFKALRPNATVLICSCGKWKHVIKKDTVIFVEQKQ